MVEPPRPPSARPAAKGRLIVIEGIDGVGKSTLAAALAEALEARGEAVVLTFEPTRGPHGQKIRRLAANGREGITPEEETELFIADRREHVATVIAPALAAGKNVILDRYFYSTMAYQGARGVDPAAIERRHRDFAPPPDLLVMLDMSVEEALERIVEMRGSTPDHFEGADSLARVRELFLSFRHPNRLLLDGRRPLKELVGEILKKIA